MKLFAVLLVLQCSGSLCITVPPSWQPKNAKNEQRRPSLTYKHPTVAAAPLSINSEQFQFHSFFPPDAKPAENVQQLQYRLPNNQNLFVYHPEPSSPKGPKIETPQSYQIVNFDKPNSEDVKRIAKPTSDYQKQQLPPRQHLTEVTSKNRRKEESSENIDNDQQEEEISEHELPREVPTRPIYPGEGQWAKYGQKHRPYIRPEPHETPEKSSERPEGYTTFENGEQQFQQAQNNFQHDLDSFPGRHNLPVSQTDVLDQKQDLGFVPEKLYTQVRRTENEQHLPRSAIDPEQDENADRLREVVKDSRIHTVYTEEGYEDEAYDHAGHEKNAENHEGHGQRIDNQSGGKSKEKARGTGRYNDEAGHRRGRNHERRRLQNDKRTKNENHNQDTDTATSKKVTSTVPTKNIKKVTTKDNVDMEIHTEVKYTPQKKKHKFVKIIPSAQNDTITSKRVKRYDKDSLSKKYVRKRPQYYWKRIKTSTTRRPVAKSREKFEAAFKTHSSKKENKFEEEDIPTTSTTESVSTSTTVSTTTTTDPSTVASTTVHPDLMNPELTTRLAKPAAPKVLPVKIRKFKTKRLKRFTNDFPKISVDLQEFPDVDKFPEPIVQPDLTHSKYPYYNLPVSAALNEDSPLRYAEDMKHIPKKVENELSFYESREHIKCPEIERNVDPIPKGGQTEGQTDKMAATPDLPRLKGLGDKIDCLKIKYFGDNPLDSPFFQEETIQDPVPFFDIQPSKISSESNERNTQKRELKIKILEPIVVLDEELLESATINPIHKNSKAVLKPPYTLTEMMTMNDEQIIKLTPKSIYDQISLLETDMQESKTAPLEEKFIIVYDNQEVTAQNDTKVVTSSSAKPQIRKHPTNVIRKRPTNVIRKLSAKTIKKPLKLIKTTTTTSEQPSTTVQPTSTTVQPPSSSVQPPLTTIKPFIPLKSSRRQQPNNWQSANGRLAAFYNIFDISRFLPLVPNHRLATSDALYKNFRKPSEQMKVYSDVLQSINNEKENKDASDSKMVAVTVSVPKLQDPTQLPDKLEATTTNQEQIPQQPETIIGMLPPPKYVPYTTISQSTTEVQIPEASKIINHFYFIGMQPPKLQQIRRKRNTDEDDLVAEESEIKPSYRKPQYTEIRRARPRPTEDPTEEEEEEDLNPRKRVYDLSSTKPRTTTSSPIYEEVEEEEPTTTTTFKPKNYFIEPNKNDPKLAEYVLFIEKLHDKWAKEDATSTTEATTTPQLDLKDNTDSKVVETVTVPKGVPEFLQIINQLHEIRQEEDAKTTTTTTSAPLTPIKNSNPFISDTTSFMTEIKSMNDKLNPEDSIPESTNSDASSDSRSRNYSSRFKTNIDTSKYKTIERAPVTLRHNLSSRFNSDEDLPLQKEKTTQTPTIIAIITRPKSETELTSTSTTTTTTTTEPVTTRSRTRGRPRGRPLYSTTTRPTTTITANPLFRRRRPTTTTTTTKPDTNLTRRRIPNRQKITTTEIPSLVESTTEDVVVITPVDEPKKQRRIQKVQERHVMSEVTFTKYFEPTSDELDSSEDKKHQYEIVAPLRDTDSLHGGNYHHETRLPNFFTDPTLAENVNQLQQATDKNSSTNVLSREEIKEKVEPVSLAPNMASMVNLLAEKNEDNYEDETTEKPIFIKDPSKRMYYYAKL